MIHVLLLFFAGPPVCVAPPDFDATDRKRTYAEIREVCHDAGASDVICETAVAIAWRESRGVPHSVHTRGRNEYGLGLYGHSPRFWRWLLHDGETFCDPADATRALLREFRFAVKRGARTIRDLQRVHSGRNPRDGSRPYRDNRWCYLLEHGPRDDQSLVSWAVDCETPITADDVGDPKR